MSQKFSLIPKSEVPGAKKKTRSQKGGRGSGRRGGRRGGGRSRGRGGGRNANYGYPLYGGFYAPPTSSQANPYFDIRNVIRAQLEFYFSTDNLIRDVYLRHQMNSSGYISALVLFNFNRMRQLAVYGVDPNLILIVAKETAILKVKNGCIRKKEEWHKWTFPPQEAPTGEESDDEDDLLLFQPATVAGGPPQLVARGVLQKQASSPPAQPGRSILSHLQSKDLPPEFVPGASEDEDGPPATQKNGGKVPTGAETDVSEDTEETSSAPDAGSTEESANPGQEKASGDAS